MFNWIKCLFIKKGFPIKLKKGNLQWSYDEEADMLYTSFGRPIAATTLDRGSVLIRVNPVNNEICGVEIINVKRMIDIGQSPKRTSKRVRGEAKPSSESIAETNDVKVMPIKEFRELGFVQEANRLFFHPRGLALEVIIGDNNNPDRVGNIWDYREDPEGIVFNDLTNSCARKKCDTVANEYDKHKEFRIKLLGSVIQSIGTRL